MPIKFTRGGSGGDGGGSFTPSKNNLYNAVKEIFHPTTNSGVDADDTNRELDVSGGSGGSFTPSKSNIYDAVKEIFHPTTNSGVSADDTNNELDVSGGTAYTLPAADEDTVGGVEAADATQASAASGTTVLGWSNNRIRALITAALPTISAGDATAGTSTARRVWTSARVRSAINQVVPTVFRSGNTDTITTAKLGTGTRDGSTYLKGDGTFGAVTPSTGGPLNALALVKVGETLTLSGSAATTGPAYSDLSDVFWLSWVYTRSTGTAVRFNTIVRKAEVEGVASGSAYRLQLQGGGGAFILLYDDSSNFTIGALDSQYSAGSVDVYKFTGSEDGITLTAGDTRYLQLSGGTLTGLLTLSGAPTADLHAATKKYVDDNAGGGGSNVPNSPAAESAVTKYVLNVATDGTATWVEDTGGTAGDGGSGEPTDLYVDSSFQSRDADVWYAMTLTRAPAENTLLEFYIRAENNFYAINGSIGPNSYVFPANRMLGLETITKGSEPTGTDNYVSAGGQRNDDIFMTYISGLWNTEFMLCRYSDTEWGIRSDNAAALGLITLTELPLGGGGGDGGDTTAIESELDEIEASLDALDVPEVVGTFADADADDLAAGYGVYPSEDGTFSDSDFVLSGTTPTAGTNRFFIRTPKYASRYGARIVLDTTPTQVLPDNDPLTQEHLVKVASRPDDAQDGYDYFFIGVTHDDAPIQDPNVNTYRLQVAPVTRQEIINVGYWQDGNRTPNVAPATKGIATVRAGELFPIVFPAHNRPRNLHFALAARYEITALYIAGSSALTDFSKVAESRLANFWHSSRIQSAGEVSCLIRIEEA